MFPDKPEKRRASQLFKAALDSVIHDLGHVSCICFCGCWVRFSVHNYMFQIDGITIGSLDDVPAGAVTSFFRSLRNTLDFDFEDENEGWSWEWIPLLMWWTRFKIINFSSFEILGRWVSDELPTLFIFINCSTRELGSIEKFVVWHRPSCKGLHFLSIIYWFFIVSHQII